MLVAIVGRKPRVIAQAAIAFLSRLNLDSVNDEMRIVGIVGLRVYDNYT